MPRARQRAPAGSSMRPRRPLKRRPTLHALSGACFVTPPYDSATIIHLGFDYDITRGVLRHFNEALNSLVSRLDGQRRTTCSDFETVNNKFHVIERLPPSRIVTRLGRLCFRGAGHVRRPSELKPVFKGEAGLRRGAWTVPRGVGRLPRKRLSRGRRYSGVLTAIQ